MINKYGYLEKLEIFFENKEQRVKKAQCTCWYMSILRRSATPSIGEKSNFSRYPYVIAGCWLILLIGGCRPAPPPNIYHETQTLLGTLVEIKLIATDPSAASAALAAAFAEFGRIDNLMSFQSAKSQLARINQAAGGKAVSIDAELFQLVLQSKYYAELTAGAFDISIGPLSRLWGLDNKQYRKPSSEEIAAKLPLVGYSMILTQSKPPAVRLARPGMSIDLGAIAKGYAVDKAINILKRRGISSALVNAGGDIRTIGTRPDGNLWNIGIQHPRKPKQILASLRVDNQAVVTSGDYEQFFMYQGVRYHHILDPATGRPARGCQAVTVVAQSTAAADALATGVFVLGPEKGMKLIEGLPDTEALIVDAAGNVSVSSGLKGKLDFNH